MANSEPDRYGSFFWAVDVPGLNREQAAWLVSMLIDGPYALHGIPVDPEEFFTVRIDREGAEVLREALRQLSKNDVAVGLSEIVDEWLDFTARNKSNGAEPGK